MSIVKTISELFFDKISFSAISEYLSHKIVIFNIFKIHIQNFNLYAEPEI